MEWARRHGILGGMTVALGLFMAVIGFNPSLAWAKPQGSQYRIGPGSSSGTLVDRLAALGYEVASLDMDNQEVTVTFDDDSVLVLDLPTGDYTLFDAQDQVVLYGNRQLSFESEDRATLSATTTFADNPTVEDTYEVTYQADPDLDGVIVGTGTKNGQPYAESTDLADFSYRPDGSTESPARSLDDPPGVANGSILPTPGLRAAAAFIAVLIIIVVVLVVGGLVGWAAIKAWLAAPIRVGPATPGGS